MVIGILAATGVIWVQLHPLASKYLPITIDATVTTDATVTDTAGEVAGTDRHRRQGLLGEQADQREV